MTINDPSLKLLEKKRIDFYESGEIITEDAKMEQSDKLYSSLLSQ